MKDISKKMRILQILLAVIITLFLAGAVAAEDPPIHVEADRMTSTEKDNSVVFTGEVDAKQGDVRIRSDVMTVYYTPKEEGKDGDTGDKVSTQKVEKLISTGNVEITRAEWLGTSKKMVYLAKERQVILTGNAKAWQGQNMVSGEKIIYHIDEGRSEVIGDTTVSKSSTSKDDKKKSGRVNMTILQN